MLDIAKFLNEPDPIPLSDIPNGLLNRFQDAYMDGIRAEREACAKVAEDMLSGYKGRLIEAFDNIAAAIRARADGGKDGPR